MAGFLLALLLQQKWAASDWLLLTGVFALVALLLLYSEQVIEAIVGRQPEIWAIRLALFARGVMFILSPFITLFLVLNHGEDENREGPGTMTEDELKILVDASQQEGVLEQDEREMIYSIFRLGDTLAREIMVPRIYITALDVTMPPDQVVKAVQESGHSRLPVYEDTIDHIVGLLYARDLLTLMQDKNSMSSVRDLLRKAYFVPEAKKVDELLDEMQARRIHMAIVIDEYGGVAGLVTLEDIVEEIVGEIRDEYDQAEEFPSQKVDEGEYVFLGRVDLDDFNELMGTSLVKEEADTIGGFMYSHIGRVPANGESIQVDDVVLSVEQVSGRRIRKVRARKIFPVTDNEESESHADG
jgi:CBS domain containing-hemolysin-like protein